MASELLATGVTAATSSDIVVATGVVASVFLKDAAGPDVVGDALVYVQVKDSASQYFTVGKLTGTDRGLLLSGPATYRLSRPGGQAVAVGAEQG